MIRGIIEKLQQQAQQAAALMGVCSDHARSSVEQTGAAGTTLERIVQAVATITDMSHQIATAVEDRITSYNVCYTKLLRSMRSKGAT